MRGRAIKKQAARMEVRLIVKAAGAIESVCLISVTKREAGMMDGTIVDNALNLC